MRATLHRARRLFPRGLLIWAGLTVVFGVAVLVGLSDLAGVPAQETMRANSAQQRVIIDPMTGVVSGLVREDTKPEAFDVADSAAPEAAQDAVEVPAEPAVDMSAFAPLRREEGKEYIPTVPRSGESLLTAPAPEISEKIGDELLPKRGEKGARPSSLYARNFDRKAKQKLVAIVVTDAGFSSESLQQLLELPGEITVGVSPYATEPAAQIEALRNKGHEVWGMLPLMSKRYPQDDPGPLGLIAALHGKAASARLHTVLANTIGSVGMILPPDQAFSDQKELWESTRGELMQRGLLLLASDQQRPLDQLGGDAAQQAAMHRADLILDTTPGAAFIRSKLAGLKDMLDENQTLVVLVSARPQTLAILADWLKEKPLDGKAVLAPLSAVYTPPEPAAAAKAADGEKKEEANKEGSH